MQTCAPHAFVLQSTHTHTHTYQKKSAELWWFMFEVLCWLTDTHRFLLCTGGVHHVDLPDNLPEVREFWKSRDCFLLRTGEQGRLVCRYVKARWSRAGVHVKGGDTPVSHTHTKEERNHRRRQNTNPLNVNKRQKLVHFRPKRKHEI